MRAYSMDLRERALLDSDAGMKAADAAAKYRVSGSWVRLVKQRWRETGEVAPRVQRQGRRGMLEPHLHTLAALLAAHPDRTLAELKDATIFSTAGTRPPHGHEKRFSPGGSARRPPGWAPTRWTGGPMAASAAARSCTWGIVALTG